MDTTNAGINAITTDHMIFCTESSLWTCGEPETFNNLFIYSNFELFSNL